MAKHCTNCGQELRDSDKFCAKCGTPVGGVAVQAQPTQWEYCEIQYEVAGKFLFDPSKFRFVAEGLGPKGKFLAGRYDTVIDWAWPHSDDKKTMAALDAFIAQLVAEGWELTGQKGDNWWNYKFRRVAGPRTARDWALRAGEFALTKRYDEALVAIDQALALSPADAVVWTLKGVTLQSLKRYDEALVAFDQALALNPGDPVVCAAIWASKGGVLAGLMRFDEAVAAYDRCLKLDPKNADAWHFKARALDTLGRNKEALVAVEKALALDPKNGDAQQLKATLIANKGHIKRITL